MTAGQEPETARVIVYVSIGNSDDKLTQAEWSRFVQDMRGYVASYARTVHGEWLSLPDARWQNACWCLEFDADGLEAARGNVTKVRDWYRQDSIAWAVVAETDFL